MDRDSPPLSLCRALVCRVKQEDRQGYANCSSSRLIRAGIQVQIGALALRSRLHASRTYAGRTTYGRRIALEL